MNLFSSPELYPLQINFERRTVRFLRMTAATYRDSLFLDERARHVEGGIDIKLDDLLLASESAPALSKPTLYILNTAFCGSTLLARYFELLPSCFVLKEPRLLAQLASERSIPDECWKQCFDLCIRLLTRTYTQGQTIIIKPLESCNILGRRLLDSDSCSSITFLGSPLRHFLLAVLKSSDRRDWICRRAQTVCDEASDCRLLCAIDPGNLSVPHAAAYVWLVDRFLCKQLAAENGDRVLPLNAEVLMQAPRQALENTSRLCGLPLSFEQIEWLVAHPSMRMHSKDASRPYDTTSRDVEVKELERCWGTEADQGVEWASAHDDGTLDAQHWP
jgi:hypothetical protein